MTRVGGRSGVRGDQVKEVGEGEVGLPKPRSASQVAASRRVPQLHPFDLAAEDTHDEGDQLVAVARLLANGTDDPRGAAGGVPGLPSREWPAGTARPRCSRAVLSQLSCCAHVGEL